MSSFQTRALDLARAFELHTRTDGSTFYSLSESSPIWMHDCVRAAHHDEMPNDWRFAMVRQLAYAIAEHEEAETIRDASLDVASDATTCYISPLLAWYTDRPGRLDYVNEWLNDCGIDSVDDGINGHLFSGQTYCIEQMLHGIIDACETRSIELVEA